MENHEEYRRLALLSLYGEATGQETATWEEHRHFCHECQEYLKGLEEGKRAAESLPILVPSREVSRRIAMAVEARTKNASLRRSRVSSLAFRPGFWKLTSPVRIALAASLVIFLLCGLLFIFLIRPPSPPHVTPQEWSMSWFDGKMSSLSEEARTVEKAFQEQPVVRRWPLSGTSGYHEDLDLLHSQIQTLLKEPES